MPERLPGPAVARNRRQGSGKAGKGEVAVRGNGIQHLAIDITVLLHEQIDCCKICLVLPNAFVAGSNGIFWRFI